MGRPKGTSKVAELYTQLVDQLTEDGYKGTQRAMRIVRELRTALEGKGFGFETKTPAGNKTSVTTPEPKTKRGPGRPRKDTTVAAAATPVTPVKRGPGRPRKVVAVATATGDSADTTPKRRVGRPRKSPVAVTADVTSSTEGSIDDLIDSLDVENPTAEA